MDKATGAHYGVPTCEGCKVDFLINRFDMKKHIDASSRAFSNEVFYAKKNIDVISVIDV